MTRLPLCLACLLLAGVLPAFTAQAQDRQVYRCPGNLYTDQLSTKEAAERGCKTLDGAAVTVIQAPRRDPARALPGPVAGSGAGAPGTRVDPAEQRARDSDARRILEAELRKEEERLAQLQRDYNNGEPERRGDERNYQKYLDRAAEMKAAIGRTEANIAGLKRELAKLPPG